MMPSEYDMQSLKVTWFNYQHVNHDVGLGLERQKLQYIKKNKFKYILKVTIKWP